MHRDVYLAKWVTIYRVDQKSYHKTLFNNVNITPNKLLNNR